MLNFPFDSSHSLCKFIRDEHFPGFMCLPYDRYRHTDSDTWWIVGNSVKSAFSYPKAIFTTAPNWKGEGDVFCGLNVEKGVTQVAAAKASNKMDQRWFWNTFVNPKAVSLLAALDDANQHVPGNLQLLITAGVLEAGDPWELLWLELEGQSLKQKSYEATDKALASVAAVADVSSLVLELGALDKLSWHWVDVLIGQSFTLDKSGRDDSQACGAMLKSFAGWLRKT